jgi:hypothetical protein
MKLVFSVLHCMGVLQTFSHLAAKTWGLYTCVPFIDSFRQAGKEALRLYSGGIKDRVEEKNNRKVENTR